MEDSELEHSQSDRIKKAMELLHIKAGVLREIFDAQESGRYIRVRNILIKKIFVKIYIGYIDIHTFFLLTDKRLLLYFYFL